MEVPHQVTQQLNFRTAQNLGKISKPCFLKNPD